MDTGITTFLKSSRILKEVYRQLNIIEENCINLSLHCKYARHILSEGNNIKIINVNCFNEYIVKVFNMMTLLRFEVSKFHGKINKNIVVECTDKIETENENITCNILDTAVTLLNNIEISISEILVKCQSLRNKVDKVINIPVSNYNLYTSHVHVLSKSIKLLYNQVKDLDYMVNPFVSKTQSLRNELELDDYKKKKNIESFMSMNFMCPVCYEHRTTKDMALPECCSSHAICLQCVTLLKKPECPMCKTEINYYIQFEIKGEYLKFNVIWDNLAISDSPETETTNNGSRSNNMIVSDYEDEDEDDNDSRFSDPDWSEDSFV